MYFNSDRAVAKLMEKTENLFPIEQVCKECGSEFSFTSLDDFGVYEYKYAYETYKTLDFRCPACKTEMYWSIHPFHGSNTPPWVEVIRPLVIQHRIYKKMNAPKTVTTNTRPQSRWNDKHVWQLICVVLLIWIIVASIATSTT